MSFSNSVTKISIVTTVVFLYCSLIKHIYIYINTPIKKGRIKLEVTLCMTCGGVLKHLMRVDLLIIISSGAPFGTDTEHANAVNCHHSVTNVLHYIY